ncbi:hypothetical protein [Ktedonobacter racemifer]|uniref:hypothetical protein n=1 Tax=Ktedonobacter racemifer TaxID=363277 RepID=UPI0012FC28E0|nr:hypothetical protein [Ktedonobacter racemifer]
MANKPPYTSLFSECCNSLSQERLRACGTQGRGCGGWLAKPTSHHTPYLEARYARRGKNCKVLVVL